MLDLKFVLSNIDAIEKMLRDRGSEFDLGRVRISDEARRKVQKEHDELRAQQKSSSTKIGEAKRKGEDVSSVMAEMKKLSDRVKELADELAKIEQELNAQMLLIPNIPLSSVPVGPDASHNKEARKVGQPRNFSFKPLAHYELGEKLGILDFERAAKLSGARFAVYRKHGAKLERALINFMLDLQTKEHGYEEIIPPYLVTAETMTGTGQLPKFEADLFKTTTGLFLIPTAEVPVTNLYANEILDEKDLPMSFVAFTPCFRSEAGSYGKDVRGLIRQHQFHKVELVKYAAAENSEEALEKMVANAEEVLKRLEIPYRVITLCTGDMGFASAKTYDIEVWLPSENTYREISSCSNCTDFQARRMNLRYRKKDGKLAFVHTLNGSGLAVGRTAIAVMENYQQEDGSILIPKALQPYMGGVEKIEAK